MRNPLILTPWLLVALLFGCSSTDDAHTAQQEVNEVLLGERMPDDEVEVVIKGLQTGIIESSIDFMQAGLIYDAEDPAITYRVFTKAGEWSDWDNAEVTWSEGEYHVARIILEEVATKIELDRSSPIIDGKIEFLPEVLATDRLTRDLPFETELDTHILRTEEFGSSLTLLDPAHRTRQQAVAPSSLVISRSGWGSRNPGKVCGNAHSPYRISIHHTAAPSTDGPDPAARMRQMQAYHIDSNGWCDLGYHFVTSQSGKIYQGRNHEGRIGAHTGNQNTGSIGISMIGNFETQSLSGTQRDATVRITSWAARTYGISINRTRIKGHREWPGQSTACPGRNFMSQFDNFVSRVGGNTTSPTPTPTPSPTPTPTPVPEPIPDPVYDVAHHVLNIVVESPIDLNGDGKADVCIRHKDGVECRLATADGFGPAIAGPELKDESGWGSVNNYATIRFGDIDGDGKADMCARANAGMRCWKFDGEKFGPGINGPDWSNDKGFTNVNTYSTIQLADINGDGKADLCARTAAGLECALSTGDGFGPVFMGPLLRDSDGWGNPQYYATMRFADVNGDGMVDLCARAAAGIRCWMSTGDGFAPGVSGPEWSNAKGWEKFEYWSTIRLIDLDNDGAADICARAGSGIVCHLADGTGNFGPQIVGPELSDSSGWNDLSNYDTIRYADVTGDGRLDLCARANAGMRCWPFDGEKFQGGWAAGPMKNESGWSNEMYFRTIAFADIDGDGRADVCARASQSYVCWKSTGSGFDSSLVAGPAWSNTAGFSDPKYYSTVRLIGAIRPIPDAPLPEPPPVVDPTSPGSNNNTNTGEPGEDIDWGDEVDPPDHSASDDLMISDGCSAASGVPGMLVLLVGFALRLWRR